MKRLDLSVAGFTTGLIVRPSVGANAEAVRRSWRLVLLLGPDAPAMARPPHQRISA